MNIVTLLDMLASAFPEREILDVDGEPLEAGLLMRRSAAGAAQLTAVGAGALLYLGGNHLALPTAVFSAAIAGVPFVPLNYRLSSAQLREIVAQHDRPLLVAAPELAAYIAAPGTPVWSPDGFIASTAIGAEPGVWPDDPERVAVLVYTSGTTAQPKAAILRHRHLTSYVLGSVEFADAADTDAALVSVPPYHIAGVANLLSNIYLGRRIVYLDRFEPDLWLDLAVQNQVTHAMVVPTMLARIVDYLERTGRSAPSSLRTLAYGGARMPARVLERALLLMPGTGFVNAYGLTETSSTVAVLGPEDHVAALASDDPLIRRRLGSVGQVLATVEIAIRSVEGDPLPPETSGEIFIRGEQVSGEYVGHPTVTDAEGWFATRDRGFLDADNFLYIEGRDDDMIIRGGENVAPAEIEEVIADHPAVLECAVLGLADDDWGHRIAAVVVLQDEKICSPDEIKDWVRARLRGWKTPEVVEFRAELPATPTGKLLRRELKIDLERVSP
jgi:acyl-CoA synthetase (AMP-forming)/AMP-acid ligase II